MQHFNPAAADEIFVGFFNREQDSSARLLPNAFVRGGQGNHMPDADGFGGGFAITAGKE
jgi:hypothetical protein